jgi:hypothetical protein
VKLAITTNKQKPGFRTRWLTTKLLKVDKLSLIHRPWKLTEKIRAMKHFPVSGRKS